MIERPTLPHILEAFAAVIIVAIIYFQWQESKSANQQFQASMSQQTLLINQAQAQAKELQADIASRDNAAQTQILALKSQVEHLNTPSEISPWLASQINKSVPQTITITAPPSTQPDAPVTASIPQADMQAVRDLVSQAQQEHLALGVCTQDKTDMVAVIKADAAKQKDTEAELAASNKRAAGGGFWKRTGRIVKYVAIGAGLGLAIAKGV